MKKQPGGLCKPKGLPYHVLFGPPCSATPTPYSGLTWTLTSFFYLFFTFAFVRMGASG